VRLVFDMRNVRGICGASRYCVSLMAGLEQVSPTTDIVVLAAPTNLDEAVERRAAAVFRNPRRVGDPREWLGLTGILRRIGPYRYVNPLYYVPAPIAKGIPRVAIVHDAIHDECRDLSHLRHQLYRHIMARAFARADLTLTDSRSSLTDIQARYQGARRRPPCVVYPGVLPPVRLPPQTRAPAPTALYVGNARPHKNLGMLIGAFEAPRLHGWRLVLAGVARGQIPAALPASIDVRPDVTDGELAQLYAEATVLVHASRIEGFGLPIVEAMARGVQVVCSDIPVFREVAGPAARYFLPGNATGLVAALQEVVVHPTPQAHLLARAALFSPRRAAEGFLFACAGDG
jgi:glycosyltransferase involved in cell wall biosynthesis